MEEPIHDQPVIFNILVYYPIGQTVSPTTPCEEFPLFSSSWSCPAHYPRTALSTWLHAGVVMSSACSQFVKSMMRWLCPLQKNIGGAPALPAPPFLRLFCFGWHLFASVWAASPVPCHQDTSHCHALPSPSTPYHSSQHDGLVEATAQSELCTFSSAVSTAALALLASHSVLHYIIATPSPLGC